MDSSNTETTGGEPVQKSWAAKAHALRRKRLWQRIGTIASILLFVAAVVVLYLIFRDIDLEKLKAAYHATSWRQILIALSLTALSYLMLTFYDALALRHIVRTPVPYHLTALASFTSFAVSFNLGFPLLTAATVRFWVYSVVGLGAGAIASLTLIAGITFWLGMSLVLGLVMVFLPEQAAGFTRFAPNLNLYIGLSLLGGVLLYIIWVTLKPRSVTIQGWTFYLPRVQVTLLQMLLGASDVCVACGVLFVLLPEGNGTPYATVVAAYVFANILGIASHSPGGLGVFEATILLALWSIEREALLGSVLLYRLCYYFLPFVIAIWLLGLREILIRAKRLRREMGVES